MESSMDETNTCTENEMSSTYEESNRVSTEDDESNPGQQQQQQQQQQNPPSSSTLVAASVARQESTLISADETNDNHESSRDNAERQSRSQISSSSGAESWRQQALRVVQTAIDLIDDPEGLPIPPIPQQQEQQGERPLNTESQHEASNTAGLEPSAGQGQEEESSEVAHRRILIRALMLSNSSVLDASGRGQHGCQGGRGRNM